MNSWYLRKPDGKEFGPESIETIRNWAEQSRILATNEVSQDRKKWQKAEDVVKLNICHIAILPDKSVYGPFNILATKDLLAHNVFTKDSEIVSKRTGEKRVVSDYLKRGQKSSKKKLGKTSGQSDFELLSSPSSELPRAPETTELPKQEKKQKSKPTKKRQDIMETDKQDLLFDAPDEDFNDDIEYVMDEDAQIEMPFEEETTVVYDSDEFPVPNQDNTVFMSKDTDRFPGLVTRKNEILSIGDVKPVEDKRQVKLFDHEEEPPDDEQEIPEVDDIEEVETEVILEKNKNSIPEEDIEPESIDTKETPEVPKTTMEETETIEEFITATKSEKVKKEVKELQKGLEATSRVFIEQKDKDSKKIDLLTAERNKLELELSNSKDALKELKQLNNDLQLSVDEAKKQISEQAGEVQEHSKKTESIKENYAKTQQELNKQDKTVSDLNDSIKDLMLALAAERDRLDKQRRLTEQYQRELDEAETKHNKIIEESDLKYSELSEEKKELDASKENLFNTNKNLDQKIKDLDVEHRKATEALEEKLISIRQELKAEEEAREASRKEVKELQSKIKSTDTIVNERIRSINEQATRVSTKYKQECRLTERLSQTNKRLMITVASFVLLLLIVIVYIIVAANMKPKVKTTKSKVISNISNTDNTIPMSNVRIPIEITLVGAQTIPEGKLVRVVFDEQMFRKLSSPSAFAIKNIRTNLASYKEYLKKYDMVIEGHTDNVPLNNNPQYIDNKSLGLARAKSFKNLLVVSFGLPDDGISTLSAGSENPPFNNDTQVGREKNKTVVIYFKNK